jgi:hypothetical protein
MPPRKSAPKPTLGQREERYLACSRCELSFTLSVNTERPQHHCRKTGRPAAFDVDVPAKDAPKRPWFEEMEKHPRLPDADTRFSEDPRRPHWQEDGRPQIVL